MEQNYDKGQRFVVFVRSEFEKDGRFTIVGNSGIDSGLRSTNEPDLQIQLNGKCVVFSLECVYRGTMYKNKLDWATFKEFDRYRETRANLHNGYYYIVVGVGDDPDCPKRIFFGPFSEFKHPSLFKSIYGPLERNITAIPDIVHSDIMQDIRTVGN
jgi:hypothetical protein